MTSTRARARRAEIETAQRSALRAFAEAIGVKATLSQDEYGEWVLRGSKARVYAVQKGAICGFADVRAPESGFLFLRVRQSGSAWMAAKPLHAFCRVCGGVEAGVLFLSRLATAAEAEAVGSVIGLQPHGRSNLRDADRPTARRSGRSRIEPQRRDPGADEGIDLSSLPAARKSFPKRSRHRGAIGLIRHCRIVSQENLEGAHDLRPFEIE
jgi:hypothetical protein